MRKNLMLLHKLCKIKKKLLFRPSELSTLSSTKLLAGVGKFTCNISNNLVIAAATAYTNIFFQEYRPHL